MSGLVAFKLMDGYRLASHIDYRAVERFQSVRQSEEDGSVDRDSGAER